MNAGEFSHQKPLDFGAGGITGSVDADGRIIALNCYDPVHGYITLTSADPFPDADRYDVQKVRAYRAALPKLAGFGLTGTDPITDRMVKWVVDTEPRVTLVYASGDVVPIATAPIEHGAAQFFLPTAGPMRFRGRLSLQRCAYTQLTEGGILPMPPLEMHVVARDGILTIHNRGLNRTAAILGISPDESLDVVVGQPIELDLALQKFMAVILYRFGDRPEDVRADIEALRPLIGQMMLRPPSPLGSLPADRVCRRGLIYGYQMCVPVGAGICILTDHMLLPLSWNRDAYFVATALLHGHKGGAELVRRHLIWMFEIAERIAGDWGRCYLANGKVKDRAYQLDQQLYPVLELCDYTSRTGDRALIDHLRLHVKAVFEGLKRHKSPDHWLFATDETPGDDPVAQPYHLSSHILLWHTLSEWASITGDQTAAEWARHIRPDIDTHFMANDADGKPMYAYTCDARGGTHLYHDANDLPTALGPAWGFCSADTLEWRNTVDFAFSAANEACFNGRLGSVHTRAPWALGDLQDVVIARALHDSERESSAWERLRQGAAIDGALPEAYDGETGAVISRTWFAWPNATAACIQLGVWG